jgi:malate dehydrogenase (oxaloacetate-decarboxylating)
MAAFKVNGTKWEDARFLMFGAGSAGTGIADQIKDAIVQNTGKPIEEARQQIW